MRLAFHTLDVFTAERFGGNALAVVLGADVLDTQRMQSIAREFNLSETVFVLKPQNPAHSARVRIFTPRSEVPFAGHPTVGTAALLAELRSPGIGNSQDAIVALEETIGTVRVGVRFRPGTANYSEFDAPRLPEELGAAPEIEELAAAIGLIPSEIGFENHKPTRYSAGLPFTFIPVRSLDVIGRARAVISRWDAGFSQDGAVYLYCRETIHNTSHFHARMFAPGFGIVEDPATGSAVAALAAVVHRFDDLHTGEHRYAIEQGFEMGRPSLIQLAVAVDRGKLQTARIGGYSVRVADGEIAV